MPSSHKYRQQKAGKAFEKAVRNAPISQGALAELLGIHQSTFSYWYRRGVTKKHAYQVADLLDIDANTITNTYRTIVRNKNKAEKRELRKLQNQKLQAKQRALDKPKTINTAALIAPHAIGKSPCVKRTESQENNGYINEYSALIANREPRTVNIELLAMVANMRLSAQQETTLHSLALTFLGEES